MAKLDTLRYIDKYGDDLSEMAMAIWKRPEGGFQEHYASTLQKDYLKKLGYRVVEPIGDVETGFYAEYGSGGPVIGILGEFDALPGLGQTVSTVRTPIEGQDYGHACGHHLLGCGSMLAFLAVAEAMKADGLAGTVRYYGCPAEESFGGKSYMAKAGAFDGLDCALTWHPHSVDGVIYSSTNAFELLEFQFEGIEAHAGIAPHMGRGALDGVELMNVGANYMREHIVDGARIHYIITDGGLAVNIVPGTAAVRYALRAPKMSQLVEMERWLLDIAKGAALMSGTKVTHAMKSRYHNTMVNYTLNDVVFENFGQSRDIDCTPEEQRFLEEMVATYPEATVEASCQAAGFDRSELRHGLAPRPAKLGDKSKVMGGSSDIGDVSYLVPMSELRVACCPIPVAAHTWQATACYGNTFAARGMRRAGEILALSTYDLLTSKQDQIVLAKAELQKDLGAHVYQPLPDGMKPHHD